MAEYKPITRLIRSEQIEPVASRFKAIAHPLRLAIVCLLGPGERTVTEICQELGTTQPNISQHLNLLHNQDLLRSRKEGNRVYYAIADQRLSEIIGMLQQIYCPEDNA